MKVKLNSEIRIISFMLVIFLTVGITGLLAYRGFKQIVNSVSAASRPELKLSILKQIISDVSDAENSVKSYRLTRDNKLLTPFYKSILAVQKNVGELRMMTADNSRQSLLVNQLAMFVDEKYGILNEFLSLHPDENITNELVKISQMIEEENKKLEQNSTYLKTEGENGTDFISEGSKKLKKRGLFQRLFRKKESNLNDTLSAATLVKITDPVKRRRRNISGEIERINRKHLEDVKESKEEEFFLDSKSEAIMAEIRSVAAGVEEEEKKLIKEKIEKASGQAKATNRLVAIFCFAAGLLILIVSFVLIRYILKKRAYEKGLREGKKQAENLARSREIFLANMSHEIRTPMNAIAGFVNQVLKTDLQSGQRDQLKIVQRSTKHLLRIINDILDYSKLEAGKFSFVNVNFNPVNVISEVIEISGPLLENKELELNYEVTGSPVENALGDPVRLRQVLLNLVSNSIKFTKHGKVTIKAEFIENGAHDFIMQVAVCDTGIGIKEEKIKEILTEYSQADSSIFYKYGGTGLGLPISNKLVELQGGSLSILSYEGEGTTVTITLPYKKAEAEEPAEAENEETNPVPFFKELNILIADDDEYNRKLLHAVLSKRNVKVSEACNGKEAVDAAFNNIYDILLMDIRMPEMSGVEATKRIRMFSDSNKARVPIIALTAVTSREKMQLCKDAGINDFLSKPFRDEELFKKINLLVNDYELTINKEAMKTKENGNDPKGELFSLDELKKLSNGDTSFVKHMIEVFIKTTLEGVKAMEEALTKKNYKAIGDHAHKIAPPAQHMGANKLYGTLKKIESDIRDLQKYEDIPALVKVAREEADKVTDGLNEEMNKSVLI